MCGTFSGTTYPAPNLASSTEGMWVGVMLEKPLSRCRERGWGEGQTNFHAATRKARDAFYEALKDFPFSQRRARRALPRPLPPAGAGLREWGAPGTRSLMW